MTFEMSSMERLYSVGAFFVFVFFKYAARPHIIINLGMKAEASYEKSS